MRGVRQLDTLIWKEIPRTRDVGMETGSYAKLAILFSCNRDFCSDIARLRICSCASGLISSLLAPLACEMRLVSSRGSISSSSEANRTAPWSFLSAGCCCFSCSAFVSMSSQSAVRARFQSSGLKYLYYRSGPRPEVTLRTVWRSLWLDRGVEGCSLRDSAELKAIDYINEC